MKRFLTLLLTLIVIVSVLAVSVSASNIPNNANTDYESGRLYNKIIYWQDYVTSSNEGTLPNVSGSAAGQTGWVTSVELPKDSLWLIYDGGGGFSTDPWYTNSSYSGDFYLDNQDFGVIWEMPYFISLEDLRVDEASVFRLSVQNSHRIGFTSVAVYATFFDLYKNVIGHVDLSHTPGNGNTYISTYSEFYLSTEFINAGAEYVKFSAEINFYNDTNADVAITVTDWQLLLPFKFDPEVFAVDGFDAWMNGYFKPIVPDMDEAGDIFDYFDDSALLFHKILDDVEAFFLSLKDCFSAWNWIWGRFLKVDWISQLLNVCFAFGAFAFLLDISVNVGRTVSGRIKNARSKDGKQTQTSRNNTKKKGDL